MDTNFGGKHIDDKDEPAAFTAMISCPDLPKNRGYEGGRFHLLEFGAYVRLEGLIAACFSGLRYHGGTPPRAPADQRVDPSAYRWVMVMYPQRGIIGGDTSFNIGAKPDHTPLQVTPDMRNIGCANKVYIFDHSYIYIIADSNDIHSSRKRHLCLRCRTQGRFTNIFDYKVNKIFPDLNPQAVSPGVTK